MSVALIVVSLQAAAETAPPTAGQRSATPIPCDAFAKKPDGSWTPTRDVNIDNPAGRGVVTLGPAVTFQQGVPFLGFDFAAELDRQCGAR